MWPTGTNVPPPVSFPDALKPSLQSTNPVEKGQLILQALVNDKTREQFRQWAVAHSSFIQYSPMMSKTLMAAYSWQQIIQDPQQQVAFISSIASTAILGKDSEAQCFCDLVEMHCFDFSVPEIWPLLVKFWTLLPDYIELGMFNQDESVHILSLKDAQGQFMLNGLLNINSSFISLMGKLTPGQLAKLFSQQDSEKKTLLFDSRIFGAALPLLINKLTLEELVPLFQIKDNSGLSVLDTPELFFAAIPFLNSMPQKSILRILSANGKEGDTPLHKPAVFEVATSFLERRSEKELLEILSLTNKDGKTSLHTTDVMGISFLLLKSISQDCMEKIFVLKDREGTAVVSIFAEWLLQLNEQNQRSCLLSISTFLEKQSSKELFRTFSEQPRLFFSLLYISKYGTENLRVLITPLIEKLNTEPEQIYQLFLILDQQGKPFLHTYTYAATDYFKQMNPEQLCQLFSQQDRNGMTLLYGADMQINPQRWAIPSLDRLSLPQLIKVFGVKLNGPEGHTPLQHSSVCKALMPFLLDLPPGSLMELLSLQDKKGGTPLHIKDCIIILKPCLQQLTLQQRIQLLSIPAHDTSSPLNNDDFLQEVGPLTPEQVLEVPEWKGYTPLCINSFFNIALPLLDKASTEELWRMLSKQNPDKSTPMDNPYRLSLVLPILFKPGRPFEDVVKLLSIENGLGNTPLHYTNALPHFNPHLDKLSNQQLFALFSIHTSKQGYAIFHHFTETLSPYLDRFSKEQLEFLFSLKNVIPIVDARISLTLLNRNPKTLLPLCRKHQIDLTKFGVLGISASDRPDQIEVPGITAADQLATELSPSWLTKPKFSTGVFSISKEEYSGRIQSIKVQMEQLWALLHFGLGEGQLHPSLLEIEGQERSSAEVQKALLEEVWEKMRDEKAWMGTPPENNKEAVHQFYCLMLVNLEEILKKLGEKNNPQETAGCLISIAAPVFQGRCAIAYQMEIQQARDLLSGEQRDLNSFIKGAAANALQIQIERLVGFKYRGNVHALTQFLYAAGMTPLPDALPPITVEAAQQEMIQRWDLLRFALGFARAVPEGMDVNWLKEQAPPDFGQIYLEAKKACQIQEGLLKQQVEQLLLERLSPEQVEKVVKLFNSFWALSFSLKGLKGGGKSGLLEHAFRVTEVAVGGAMPLSNFIVDSELFSAGQLEECREKIETFMKEHRKSIPRIPANMKRLMDIQNAEKTLIKWMHAIIDFDARLSDLSPAQRLHLLHVKQQYEQKLEQISEDLKKHGISFAPGQQTPSEACEEDRRMAYIKHSLGEEPSRGQVIMHILSQLGLTQKKVSD